MLSKELYKISKLIISGNIRQLSLLFEEEWLNTFNKKDYNELTNEEKDQLKSYIEERKKEVESEIKSKIKNPQYVSWIYDILISKDQKFEDINKMSDELKNFEYIKKNKEDLNNQLEDKLQNKDFDIKTYKTFGDLHKFTTEYLPYFKKRAITIQDKPNFELVDSTSKFNIYKITKDDKKLFQKLYGKEGYNTAWCVADKNEDYFEYYLERNDDCYYLFLHKNNKPYVLLHLNSNQFKDIHDEPIEDYSDDILQFLSKFDFNKFSDDLTNYKYYIIKYKNPNMTNNELFVELYKDEASLTSEGLIDFDGNILSYYLNSFVKNGKLMIQFNKINGSLNCSDNQLTSLEGCPKEITYDFNCSYNKLTNLKGCPEKINGYFSCSYNQLTSLEGCPSSLNGMFSCIFNQLTSLKGCPKTINGSFVCSNNKLTNFKNGPKNINGYFDCSYNKLTNLIGCPSGIFGNFNCSFNNLTSLEGCPIEKITNFNCSNNKLTSLEGCPIHVYGKFNCSNNKLKNLDYKPITNKNDFIC